MIYCSDPSPQNIELENELTELFVSFIKTGSYVKGSNCSQFEKDFAAYNGVNHALGVANATDALEIALTALNVGSGDEVITTSLTAVATACAIKNVGADVVFADTEADSYNIDAADVVHKITSKTKVIIAVHLHGNPCDIKALNKICTENNLYLVEDCSQAHGATVDGKKVGSFGDISCFSFYPTKNLAALGDGGAILTRSESIMEKCNQLHQYGWINKISVSENGRNSRLDELQASFLNLKLKYLEMFNAQRREIAQLYNYRLQSSGILLPKELPGTSCVYHQYVIRSPHRNKIRNHLQNKGIFCGLHYEFPVHMQPTFMSESIRLPNTEKQVSEILSLPIYPGLKKTTVKEITNLIGEVYK